MTYVIDRHDRIVSVDDGWDRFALANNGPVSKAVLGRSLWPQFGDANTRQIWRHLLERVRAGQMMQFTIRCDAPAIRRTVALDLSLASQQAVRVHARVVGESARAPIALLDPEQPRSDQQVCVCSWCHAVRMGTAWLPLETAASRADLFNVPRFTPAITHGICDTCEATIAI